MSEAITFGDAEAATLHYLLPLAGVPVVHSVPNPRPPSFVWVILTGTTRRGLALADAHITVECWAASDSDAQKLARRVYGLLSAMDLPDGTHVPDGADGWAGGPYADADPASKTPRYVMTVVVRQPAIVL